MPQVFILNDLFCYFVRVKRDNDANVCVKIFCVTQLIHSSHLSSRHVVARTGALIPKEYKCINLQAKFKLCAESGVCEVPGFTKLCAGKCGERRYEGSSL